MRLLPGCLLAAACSVVAAAAPEQELERVRARIDRVERELARVAERFHASERALAEAEQALAHTQAELARLRDERRRLAGRRRRLDERRQGLEAELERARGALAAALRAGYALTRTPLLAVALNPDAPSTLARAFGYHRALLAVQQRRLQAVDEAAERLRSALAQARAAERQLAATRERLEAARQRLRAQRDARRDALARLEALERDHGRALARLREREQALEEVLARLASGDGEDRGLAGLEGRLPWPVHGRTERPPRGSQRHGVLIRAPAGTPVAAVAAGRVVFARWLRSFGLLLIIDHGDGYLSLYGHNQRLLKAVGDRVAAGETIATVGDSGGQPRPALYLELRHGTAAVDPFAWLAPTGGDRG